MSGVDALRAAIARQQSRLRANVPPQRQAAVLALLAARDRLPRTLGPGPAPDVVTGRPLADSGGNLALRLWFEAGDGLAAAEPHPAGEVLTDWADRFLRECGHLAEAELVLGHCQTGFMRLTDDGEGTFRAWVATKRAPPSWRERADIDWWAAWLAERHEPDPLSERPEGREIGRGGSDLDDLYRRRAEAHLEAMAYQVGYPPDAVLDGCAIRTYLDVLGCFIRRALRARDRGEAATPQREGEMVAAIGAELAVDPAVVQRAVRGFTLGPEGAAYHAAVPGVAAAPLVRVDPNLLVWSVRGLTTEPLFFLTRELKRRTTQEYHNTAHLREGVFRQDLYALFRDKRFVTSAGRIELRRDRGDVRTDIDAVVFDRKTGALGLFELKSQDPFARSPAELSRQRDNVLYANRQISAVLDWLQRHGADALLGRVDPKTAKTFRVRRVYPFVLGRSIVHFNDGAPPTPRAAWATWPQLLRLLDGRAPRSSDANPLASLFARLQSDAPPIEVPADGPPRVVAIGDTRLVVHPRFAALRGDSTNQGDKAVPAPVASGRVERRARS